MSSNQNQQKPINNRVQVPKVLIVIGHILQAISHNLATHFAVKLFKTPFKFKTPQKELDFYKNAETIFVEVPKINKKVKVFSVGNSEKRVLLVHGWSGRGTQLFKIAEALVNNGYKVISFDGPAHGDSTGKTTMMTEFIESIFQLEKEYGSFEFAIGHSLGGMSVLNAVKQGLNVKKIVSIGAGDIITDIIIHFVNKLQLKPLIVKKMKGYFLKRFNEDIDNYSASIAANEIKISTLIIHDEEDKEVNVSCAYNIRQKLESGDLHISTGLGHTRILRDKKIVERVVSFLKSNI